MRVLICGSRNWTNEKPIRGVLNSMPRSSVIIHGAANGADTIAGDLAEEMGMKVLAFPADWKKYHNGAGPIRNAQMLEEGRPDVVYAFSENLAESKGTKNMIKQARAAGVKVVIYDGDRRAY